MTPPPAPSQGWRPRVGVSIQCSSYRRFYTVWFFRVNHYGVKRSGYRGSEVPGTSQAPGKQHGTAEGSSLLFLTLGITDRFIKEHLDSRKTESNPGEHGGTAAIQGGPENAEPCLGEPRDFLTH